jgi:hypothetical protein
MRRMSVLEAGFFTNCLDQAMAGPADPNILNRSELSNGVGVALEQHRAYWLAFGFNCYTRQSNIAATFLRFQAQTERMYRRAVEDFHRLLKIRDLRPPEKYQEPIEPIPSPNPQKTGPPPRPARHRNPQTNPTPSHPPRSLTAPVPPSNHDSPAAATGWAKPKANRQRPRAKS